MSRRPGLAAGLVLAASLAVASAATGDTPQPVVVDRVIAVVGPRPLLLSDLRARAVPALAALDKAKLPPAARAKAERDLFDEIVEHMIEAELVAQAAERAGIEVTAGEIDGSIARIAARLEMSVPSLLFEVQKQGISEAFYREEIGRQIREAKLLQARPPPRGVKMAELTAPRQMEVLERMRKDWLAELRRATHVEIRPVS